jgi:molybdopterin molybdotransferase
VSVGVKDLVRGALKELGADEVFWRVAVRPGKPVAFAVRGETLVFGLPGNPVSSLVAFELFVRPALRALQGAEPGPFYVPGRLDGTLRRNEARDDLVRATLRADAEAVWLTPLSGQSSHMIVRAAAADVLVRVPRGEGELGPGSTVRYLKL